MAGIKELELKALYNMSAETIAEYLSDNEADEYYNLLDTE